MIIISLQARDHSTHGEALHVGAACDATWLMFVQLHRQRDSWALRTSLFNYVNLLLVLQQSRGQQAFRGTEIIAIFKHTASLFFEASPLCNPATWGPSVEQKCFLRDLLDR
jgi:hypothetical protein